MDSDGLKPFLGFKGSASLIIGVQGYFGIIPSDGGGFRFTAGFAVTIGGQADVGVGPTLRWDPGTPTNPDSTGGFAGPLKKTTAQVGPVDFEFTEPGQPPTFGISPTVGGGAAISLFSGDWFSGGINDGGTEGYYSSDPRELILTPEKIFGVYGKY